MTNNEKELLQTCKELRAACAVMMRILYRLAPLTDELSVTYLIEEMESLGIKEGFGVRAQKVIARAERGVS
jgi:hypothetical protein